MNRMILRCAAAILLLASTCAAQSFWEDAGGVPTIDIRTVTGGAGRDVFTSAGDRLVWYSSDDGTSWISRPLPPNDARCTLLAMSEGGVLYAGTQKHGLFLSTDKGMTWSGTAIVGDGPVSIAFEPSGTLLVARDYTIWSAGSSGGIVAQIATFSDVVQTVLVAGNAIYVADLYGVHVSSDRGLTWTRLLSTTDRIAQLVRLASGTLVVRYQQTTWIERSTDNGATWSRVLPTGRPNGDNRIAAMTSDGTTLLIGLENARMEENGGGVRLSSDGGATWQDAFDGFSALGSERSMIVALAHRSDGTFFAGSVAHGLYRSRGGFVWERADRILPLDVVHNNGYGANNLPRTLVAFASGVVIAGTRGAGVFTTQDAGRTWTQRRDLVPASLISSLVRAGTRQVYAAANGTGIWRVDPLGATTRITPPLRSLTTLAIARTGDGTLFACAQGDSLYRSSDEGETWQAVGDAPTTLQLATLRADDLGRLYGTGPAGAYTSTDGGGSWVALGRPIPQRNPFGPVTVDRDGTLFWCEDMSGSLPPWTGQVYRRRTSDTGWTALFPADAWIHGLGSVTGIDIADDGTIFICHHSGVRMSTDHGDTWRIIPSNFDRPQAISYSPDGVLYVIGSRSVGRMWAFDALDVSLIATPERDTLGVDPATGLCTPNPFSLRVAVRNGSSTALDNVNVEVTTGIPDTVLAPATQLVASVLAPGATSDEKVWNIRTAQDSAYRRVVLTCTMRSAQFPPITREVTVVVPPRPKPALSGALVADVDPVPWDTTHWRTGGRPSAYGGYNVVRVDAIAEADPVPARRVTATLESSSSMTLERGYTTMQLVRSTPLYAGQRDTVSWLLRVYEQPRDTVLMVRVTLRDDSSSARADLELPLRVQGMPAPIRADLSVGTIPHDTLHYLPSIADYEGSPSPNGSYTVFPLRMVARNPAPFAALDVRFEPALPQWMVVDDSIASVIGYTIAAGDSLVMTLHVRARPDSVWRTAQICALMQGVNTEAATVCTQLVVAPVPRLVAVEGRDAPAAVLDLGIVPQPVSAAARVTYHLPAEASVRVTLSDLLGREVAVLDEGRRGAGRHDLQFDAASLPSGVYLCSVTAGPARRSVLVRVQH